MIRGRGVKVKEFVLNGSFTRLYGTKCPANGYRKSLDFKVFDKVSHDRDQLAESGIAGVHRCDCEPKRSQTVATVPSALRSFTSINEVACNHSCRNRAAKSSSIERSIVALGPTLGD